MKFFEIRMRRGTEAEWALENPVLGPGEPGWVEDTRKLKVGDGSTAWEDLPYLYSNHLTFEVSDTPPEDPYVGLVHIPSPNN